MSPFVVLLEINNLRHTFIKLKFISELLFREEGFLVS